MATTTDEDREQRSEEEDLGATPIRRRFSQARRPRPIKVDSLKGFSDRVRRELDLVSRGRKQA